MGTKRSASPPNIVTMWVKRQSMKVKIFFGVTIALFCLVAMKLFVKEFSHFFVVSEACHATGILVLVYKLTRQKTCSDLSLRSQELTAIFLAVRLICSVMIEGDVHTVLDLATLISTLWVIYVMRFKLKSTYIKDLDNTPLYFLVVPSAVLAVLVHPRTQHSDVSRILWAFCVYLESVSVLPQLRMMQNAKMIEPFTAHYVFALGIARFLGCAYWIIKTYETGGRYVYWLGSQHPWVVMALVAEMVQTFILSDFCYYYIKRHDSTGHRVPNNTAMQFRTRPTYNEDACLEIQLKREEEEETQVA